MEYKSEAQLQSICYSLFRMAYPDQLYKLFLIYNNPPNAIVGSKLKSMGMQRGIADYLYFSPPPNRRHVWIECKIGKRDQSDVQENFQNLVEMYGDYYHVCWDEVEFMLIIKSYQ